MIHAGPIHIPPPTPRQLSVTMLVVVILVLFGLWRGEQTRDKADVAVTEVRKVDSACARAAVPNAVAADITECQRLLAVADQSRSLKDSCIVQAKTMPNNWYLTVTKCPPKSEVLNGTD